MSNLDKTIRLLIAAIWIFAFGFVCECWWWLVGLLPLLSAVYGFCPLYQFIGKKGYSCPFKKPQQG